MESPLPVPERSIHAVAVPSSEIAPARVAGTIEYSKDDARSRGVTFRVVVLSLLLAVLFGYALPVIDYKLNNTFLGGSHLPPGAIGVLLILVLIINPLLRLLSKGLALSRNEALTVYITCLFSCLVPGHGAENFIVPNMVAPFYFAKPENKWLEWIQPHLRPWLTPSLNADQSLNRAVYEGWFIGLSNDEVIPWAAWMLPLAFWGTFIMASYVMLACLSVMLRAQWAEREALAFPLLRLPLTLTEDLDRNDKYAMLGQFFRDKLMWIGFGIAVFVQMLRGLHLYYPEVPDFPLGIDLGPMLTEAPWNQAGWLPLNIYVSVIGITYFLASEVSFSLWFFYWLIKFEMMGAYQIGYAPGTLPALGGLPDRDFLGYQMGGAYLAYVAMTLWTGREHFRHVIRRAFRRVRAGESERTEVMSYPAAFWGFVLSFVFMTVCTVVSGVRLDIALVMWFSYLILAIGLTRVAVEGGLIALQHSTMPVTAAAGLVKPVNANWLNSASGMEPAALFQAGLIFHMRGFSMPSYLHSFKLAHDQKIAPRPLLALIAAVVTISLVMSLWMTVRLGYENGGLTLGHKWWAQQGSIMPAQTLDNLKNLENSSALVNWSFLGVGALLTYGMMLARSRLAWFPLHPIGYLMALNYPMAMFWASILIGWMIKSLIMRFGGHDTYRKASPLFLGLILGDIAMIFFWLLIDGWQGRTGHLLLPG
jgi:hypothetical protein